MLVYIIYILTGLLIGLLSGLLGIGGGLVAVPALLWIFTHQGVAYAVTMHMAIGTSLGGIIFTSLAAVLAFNKQQSIVWPYVVRMLPGIIIGTLVGAAISDHISTHGLKIFFGVFVLIMALRMFFTKKDAPAPGAKPHKVSPFFIVFLGTATGLLAGLLGVGGSVIIIPGLLYCGLTMRQCSGTSIASILPVALVGTLSMIAVGWHHPNLPPFSTGYVNWPAALGLSIPSIFSVRLGAKWGKQLPQLTLRKAFAVFLIFVALNMLF